MVASAAGEEKRMPGNLTEAIVLRLLPRRRLPIIVSYTGAALVVAASALIRYSLGGSLVGYPVLLFVPAVFLCALLFDRGAGYAATVVSAMIAWGFFMEPGRSILAGGVSWLPVVIFLIIGFTISAITEALRHTVRRLNQAERSKSLLLEELAHRTKNDLAIIGAAITLQRNASADPAVKDALGQAHARVMIVASAQDRLRGDFTNSVRLDLAAYVDELCTGLGALLRGLRPIAVQVECPSAMVPGSTAITVGLVVNELVTNCFKYAFPDEAAGTVRVSITVEGRRIVIDVEDDGIGCPDDFTPGLGSRLVRMLAQQKAGTMTREDLSPGCRVRVDLKETSAE
jgi:two-component sensor histidine kinase